MARTYKRDARGRFSSTGASRSGRTGGGTLAARTSLRKSRAKLAGKDAADTSVGGTLSKRAQKGAVTRGEKRLKEVRKASTVKMQGMKRSGTIAKGGRGVSGSVARSLAAVKRGRARVEAPVAKSASSVFNSSKQAERLARAESNRNRTRWESIRAGQIASSKRTKKAVAALRKAQKSQMTARVAMDFLLGRVYPDTFRTGSRYLAGNRQNVAPSYSFARVAGAYRAPKSRIVAPPAGSRIGRAIPGSGGQDRSTTKGPRLSRVIRRRRR